ncbi:MAG: family 16 glycosylhydrolase [Paracoccus sp. (in: a-proteobacteria)]|uniref:hypothetical protein n=1 Tax=Paracoccus sp. TaxID=267 RepID=UPI0039E5BF60
MPDLSKYEIVLHDDFDTGLNAYRGESGIWSTSPRRDDLMTNGPKSVFLSDATVTADGETVGINPLSVSDGSLHISSGVIPTDKLAVVREALQDVGRGAQADNVRYYTGMVTTADTWAQAYGYYEITAEIPVGKGHWPAFWLAPAGVGWPPEIDIFEIYSKGVGGQSTAADNTFTVASFFDRYDLDGNPTQSVDVQNPYALDKYGQPSDPVIRHQAGGEQYMFQDRINALTEYGADIFTGKWTWACEWLPDYIVFYFGKDRDSMVEIYRTPTPQDLTSPMYTIINDQISSTWGWDPVEGLDDLTFAKGNDFSIDSVSIYALRPDRTVTATTIGETIVDDERGSVITGSAGNDIIVTGGGAGQDFVALGGGGDILHFTRGIGNAIVSGFGADDRVVLEGFHFDGAQGAMSRLTQVGKDVWLTNGAYPADPQTIIFRDSNLADFRAEQFVVRWSVTPEVWNSKILSSERLRDQDGDGHVWASSEGSRMTDVGSSFAGSLTMHGGEGGDVYYLYGRDTRVVEAANGGVDTVYSSRSMTLAQNVENLIAAPGVRGITLAGNDGDNRIEGNGYANTLQGGVGQDLVVSHGADVIVHGFGDGHDVVEGFDGADRIRLEGYAVASARDLLSRLVQDGSDVRLDLGEGGSITFRDTKLSAFGAENFEISAGGGNAFGSATRDPYALPSISAPGQDVPVDPLPSPVEGGLDTGTLRGTPLDDVLRGGSGDDLLRGYAGNDWLYGGTGSNHMNGGEGNDTLVAQGTGDRLFGAAGADTFILDLGATSTAIMDFARGDKVDVSRICAEDADLRLVKAGLWFNLEVQNGADWDRVCAIRSTDAAGIWDALITA